MNSPSQQSLLKRLFTRFTKRGSVLQGALILGGGAAGGQAIMLLATPVISRLYTPSDIGQLALYLSFVNVALTIAPLGFQRALPTTRLRREASTLAMGILLLQPPICALLALAQYGMIHFDLLGFGELPPYIAWLTGFSVIANSILFTLQFWFVRAERYGVISRVQVYQNLGRATTQIGAGFAGFGLAGLIVGDFVGRLLGLSGMLRRAWPYLISTLRPFRPGAFGVQFRRYRKFFFPQLPSNVINMIARMLPVPLLVHYFGADAAGLYAMVERVLQAPVALISKSFGDALHGRLGTYSRKMPEKIPALFLKSSAGLFAIGILPTLLVMIWGEPIFTFVLGAQWTEAGTMAGLIVPLALSKLVVGTTSRVAYIFQAFYTLLLYNLALLVAVISAFLLSSRLGWDLMTTVGWIAGLSVAAYLLYYLLLLLIVIHGSRKLRDAPASKNPDAGS